MAVCRRGRLGGARRFGAHTGGQERGHIVAAARPPTACYLSNRMIQELADAFGWNFLGAESSWDFSERSISSYPGCRTVLGVVYVHDE